LGEGESIPLVVAWQLQSFNDTIGKLLGKRTLCLVEDCDVLGESENLA
jgi:hypothetical protein